MQRWISSTSEDICYQCATWFIIFIIILSQQELNSDLPPGFKSSANRNSGLRLVSSSSKCAKFLWGHCNEVTMWHLLHIQMKQQKPVSLLVCVMISLPLTTHTHRTCSTAIHCSLLFSVRVSHIINTGRSPTEEEPPLKCSTLIHCL